MELKKICLVIFSVMVLITLLGLGLAQARPIVSISNFYIENGPIDTNTTHFTLKINLENSGSSCAEEVIVSAQTTSPFITDGRDPATNPIEICNGNKTVDLQLKLQLDTVGGSYPITLVVNYADENSTNAYSFSDPITIFIHGNSDT